MIHTNEKHAYISGFSFHGCNSSLPTVESTSPLDSQAIFTVVVLERLQFEQERANGSSQRILLHSFE